MSFSFNLNLNIHLTQEWVVEPKQLSKMCLEDKLKFDEDNSSRGCTRYLSTEYFNQLTKANRTRKVKEDITRHRMKGEIIFNELNEIHLPRKELLVKDSKSQTYVKAELVTEEEYQQLMQRYLHGVTPITNQYYKIRFLARNLSNEALKTAVLLKLNPNELSLDSLTDLDRLANELLPENKEIWIRYFKKCVAAFIKEPKRGECPPDKELKQIIDQDISTNNCLASWIWKRNGELYHCNDNKRNLTLPTQTPNKKFKLNKDTSTLTKLIENFENKEAHQNEIRRVSDAIEKHFAEYEQSQAKQTYDRKLEILKNFENNPSAFFVTNTHPQTHIENTNNINQTPSYNGQ